MPENRRLCMIFSRDKVRLLFTPQDAVVPDMKHVKIKKFLAENCPTSLWKSLGILFFILSEPFLFLPLNLSLKATFFIMRMCHFHPCVTVSFSTVSGSPNILAPHAKKKGRTLERCLKKTDRAANTPLRED
ncbi:hypothetical protein [Anaeromassilibacillus sp. Marseille-P3371]|uniref:hypothetical protein n=1 Tax=Anaeromassilibacillus sp. Marseille-P3371 TaxID=1944639 RepID=UPI001177E398|nr:hypothetical protein [Anaeromassilibacillus sp. Marseille-P3371]